MRLAEIQGVLRGAFLLLGLWELLIPIQCSPGRPSWHYISSEIVIPRKLMPQGKLGQVPGWLSYSLHFGGQRHVIHMRCKKLFLPRHLQVVSQDDQGALQMDYPYVPRDCHYLGFLEEIPYSMVTITTCYRGLEGIMKLNDLTYEIKPLNDSLIFEHVVSEIVADANITGPTYGLGSKDPPLSEANTPVAPRISSKLYASHQVMVGHQNRPVIMIAMTIAFKVGRTFGLQVDKETCYCQRRSTCIMTKQAVMTDVFSNCSIVDVQNLFDQDSHCAFQRIHQHFNDSLTKWFCGNSRVDPGEQCDCGSLKQCYNNRCCEQNCKLSTGSLCNEDLCCTNCTYSSPGTLCRPIKNICDLPEYCTGSSRFCPDNFYLQDGTPCSEVGYCFHGNCTDRSIQCKEIFGPSAVDADSACYTINTKGSRFGHCRRDEEYRTHDECKPPDMMCGRLQCTNITYLPNLQDHVAFHHSLISGAQCFGLDEHRSTETIDVGYVRPGTPCGNGKYCFLGGYCNGSLHNLNYDCHPEKCHFRGVCNNQKKCHCHVGWEPPLCLNPGAGGSENSGPPPRRFRIVTTSEWTIIYFRLLFARIYSFIFVLLFGMATNVKTISKKKDAVEDVET
ncbi:PREDICTED: disintegrin and metalloproteinase domain-containing protein 21-like [Elephantulus edwardii]|uniref:disintegrin and metalloproteinase domain-containing protein 21-like n=1 Tax=Elephantulus edwardii TaxID=28737 RepID=UPI0003F0CA7E|nr:PREDICTED: disintegrin and metalloproteinase domain-containing protein 21-like [Elephantulus edwardii]